MKRNYREMRVYLSAVFVFLLTAVSLGQITWTGAGADNNFSTAANWSGTVVPGASDDIIFDGTSSKNCDFDGDFTINDITIASTYTGTIDALATAPTLNNFSQAGGTFVSTSANMDVTGNMVLTGGVFNNNGGDVSVYVGTGSTWSISGAFVFNNLIVSTSIGATTTERFISLGTSTVTNLILQGLGRPFSYQGNVTITTDLTIQGTNTGNPTANTGTFIFSGAGPLSITGAGAAARNKLPNIEVATSGTISMTGHISVQGNWAGTQGTLSPATSTEYFYGASASITGTAAAFDNLIIQSGSTLSLPASAEVKVARNFTKTGGVSSSLSSTLTFNGGTTSQTIGGTGGFTLGSIRTEAGARTITLGIPLTLLDELKIGGNVVFASGGNLTLHADASSKARVAQIDAGGSVTGNVTVETYVPGIFTGWANWGVNGVDGQTVANWDAQIPMTCDGCTYGVTGLGSYFESIQGWEDDAGGGHYDTTITSSTPLDPGRGFWVYVGSGVSSTSDFTLSHTGNLVQGNQAIPFTNLSGFFSDILIANPYASPVSWDAILTANSTNTSNLDGAYYVWVADLNGGAGGQASYAPGSGSSPFGVLTSDIPAGQGFYISSSLIGSPFTLNITEAEKSSSNASVLKPQATAGSTKLRLYLSNAAGDIDETLLHFNTTTSYYFDKLYDARKRFNTPGYVGYPGEYSNYSSISTRCNGLDYAINSLPDLTQNRLVDVLVKVSETGFYTLSARHFENFSSCLLLRDKLTNTYHNLLVAPYTCQISDTTTVPRFELLVCESGGSVPIGIKEHNTSNTIFLQQDQTGVLVTTAFEKQTSATISVYNLLGQPLQQDIQVSGTETSTHINLDASNQFILVKVSTASETVTKKFVR